MLLRLFGITDAGIITLSAGSRGHQPGLGKVARDMRDSERLTLIAAPGQVNIITQLTHKGKM
jgi:hypothetical protein